ncbi:hypothetical protein ACHAW6_007768 [Cyclotella cf. meneghiniana]
MLSNSVRKTRSNRDQQQRTQRRRQAGAGIVFASALISAAVTLSSNSTHCALANRNRQIKATAYYYPSKYYERNGWGKPENIDFTKVSKVNYASFQTDDKGNIWGTDLNADAELLFGPVNWNPPEDAKKSCYFASKDNLPTCQFHDVEKGLIRKAHSTGTRVYATIGGYDLSEPFSTMAADPEARKKFAHRCAQIITNYDFDGIDIDWRFPHDSKFPGSTVDMANYSLLVSQVRDELDELGTEYGEDYGLSATLPCSSDNIANVDINYLDIVLDELNLLTVDFHGPWDGIVGPSAPLYDQDGEDGLSVDSCVSTYLDAGASREKINIALPFYGRRFFLSFSGASELGQNCSENWAGDCSDSVTWQESGGSPSYFSIYQKLPDLNITFDIQTMSSFAYSDVGLVSFDDERSICLKTEYVIKNELGGFVILELGGDLLEKLSTPLLDAMNLKLLNTELSCNSNAFMESLLRRAPIVHEGRGDPIEDIEESVAENHEEPKQEYRYICGSGEGDARQSCSTLGWEEGWEETSCNTGTCPDGMLCFLEICDVVPSSPFVKPVPKGKPKRKPPVLSFVATELSSEVDPPLPENKTHQMISDSNMVFSCGLNFQHAESCGQLCPNGLPDCPTGQFCFWLECKTDLATSGSPSENSALPPYSDTTLPETTIPKYMCGSTRDDALTCAEDCDSSWHCLEGKDCFLVQCPF